MAGAIPHSFLCPITCDVKDRPVVAADGHSYELEAITRWLESHTTSPLTNATLHTTVLIPNVALRSAIEEWRAVQPMAIDPERLSLSEELIGEGSFGRVVAGVLATHGREQRVAVKTLPALSQREARAQFENDAPCGDGVWSKADGMVRRRGHDAATTRQQRGSNASELPPQQCGARRPDRKCGPPQPRTRRHAGTTVPAAGPALGQRRHAEA